MAGGGRLHTSAAAETSVLCPEAADALEELAMLWKVDLLEAYRLLLWIAVDPSELGSRVEIAAASVEPVFN